MGHFRLIKDLTCWNRSWENLLLGIQTLITSIHRPPTLYTMKRNLAFQKKKKCALVLLSIQLKVCMFPSQGTRIRAANAPSLGADCQCSVVVQPLWLCWKKGGSSVPRAYLLTVRNRMQSLTDACLPLEFTCWSPNPQYDGIRKWVWGGA